MRSFNNPLDNIRVASPCSADWNQMYGNERRRFCGDCKLNVYNLSDMTRDQAENFLMASEGRVCVRFFRRADGTVLTRNCPVGWRAIRRSASRVVTASFSLVAGVLFGFVGLRTADSLVSNLPIGSVPAIEEQEIRVEAGGLGDDSFVLEEADYPALAIEGQVDLNELRHLQSVVGRVSK